MASDNSVVTCSFTMSREVYNEYKSIVAANGESVKGNIVDYMKAVIRYGAPNADTIQAMREVEALKADPNKKTYGSFSEILEEMQADAEI